VAPDRSSRERCYESRDRLFECLDNNDILDAVREDEKSRRVCRAENEGYERDCARAWVSGLPCLPFGVDSGRELAWGYCLSLGGLKMGGRHGCSDDAAKATVVG
jgi:Cytochrome oxidase c subunit VIb